MTSTTKLVSSGGPSLDEGSKQAFQSVLVDNLQMVAEQSSSDCQEFSSLISRSLISNFAEFSKQTRSLILSKGLLRDEESLQWAISILSGSHDDAEYMHVIMKFCGCQNKFEEICKPFITEQVLNSQAITNLKIVKAILQKCSNLLAV